MIGAFSWIAWWSMPLLAYVAFLSLQGRRERVVWLAHWGCLLLLFFWLNGWWLLSVGAAARFFFALGGVAGAVLGFGAVNNDILCPLPERWGAFVAPGEWYGWAFFLLFFLARTVVAGAMAADPLHGAAWVCADGVIRGFFIGVDVGRILSYAKQLGGS